MSAVATAALGGVVAVGALVQRTTGMGFALVSVPALALLLGPAEGVALVNCAAGVSARSDWPVRGDRCACPR